MATNSLDEIFISDTLSHCIQVFDSKAQFIRKFGIYGTSPNQISHPRGIRVSETGDVLVCDSVNNRIQVYTSEGNLVHTFGANHIEKLSSPSDVAILCNGDVIVSDTNNDRIQIFK